MTEPLPQNPIQPVSLWIYPIKSCAGIEVSSAHITPESGLAGDRDWIIVDHEDQQIWMGGNHQMALIQPHFDGSEMVLRASGKSDLRVPLNPAGQPCQARIWNDIDKVNETFSGQEAGEKAALWLSEVLGQTARLVKLGEEGITRKALLPLHVVSLASLRKLNQQLSEKGHPAVEHQRFRANLVIDHPELEPFAEEGFSELHWSEGSLILEMTGNCIRCIMPNVNPEDATAGREPLASVTALSRERQQKNPIFGVYAKAKSAGVLTRGQPGTATTKPISSDFPPA
ncbi:MOSC domain-containing protein [Deinococcus roseus]|uniref:MOSC domain-containing protein n=1 Tax=Deinococcus roseus TaxID=392414 RepID=A0ABQ2CXU9_9DEIO|nr:MOSC N-terminal beta barrel domain-containing protein [Deinococcus roseus]GGJ31354.1 hypothetical protein GCM10008938_16930 [Deinococcus roseus]